MMAALKLGLAGCGRIAQLVHLKVLRELPGVELAAVAEADPQRLDEARRLAPGAAAVSSYEELIAMPGVEAVVICLPNDLHARAAAAALRAGKHVYLEKPLATSLAEARPALEAWRRAGRVGMIGFNYRFHPLYRSARLRLERGELDELLGARSVFCSAARPLPPWKRSRQSGGGALLDLASHHIDLVHYLFGQAVCEVAATLRSVHSEDDTATVELRLAGGMQVQSFFSLDAVDEDRFEIYGRGGKLIIDRQRLGLVESLFEKMGRPRREPSYAAALQHFVAAAEGRLRAEPDFEDGRRSLAIVEAAEESARTGRAIALDAEVCA